MQDRNNPIRLLFIVGTLRLGGSEILVENWCEALHGNGFECMVLCINKKEGPHLDKFDEIGVRVIESYKLVESNPLVFFYRLRNIVKTVKPDLVHSQCAWSIPQQAYAIKMGGAKGFIITVHNIYSQGSILQGIKRKVAMLISRPYVDKIIGVSEAVSTYARSWLGLPCGRVETILNGIVFERFKPPELDKTYVRKELGLPEDGTLAVTVGGLSPQKDHMTLMKAAVNLRTRIPSLQFVLVGDGRERQRLSQYLQNNGTEDSVIFMGRRTDVPRILQACDLFVLSSRWEGLPIVLLEAHASGLPIVATNVSGNPEIVQDGQTGILVSVGNSEALATAIEFLVTNLEKAVQMGHKGREYIRKNFNMEKCVGKYANIYKSLVNRNTNSLGRNL